MVFLHGLLPCPGSCYSKRPNISEIFTQQCNYCYYEEVLNLPLEIFFFFLTTPMHEEVPRPGTEHVPQEQPEPLL